MNVDFFSAVAYMLILLIIIAYCLSFHRLHYHNANRENWRNVVEKLATNHNSMNTTATWLRAHKPAVLISKHQHFSGHFESITFNGTHTHTDICAIYEACQSLQFAHFLELAICWLSNALLYLFKQQDIKNGSKQSSNTKLSKNTILICWRHVSNSATTCFLCKGRRF